MLTLQILFAPATNAIGQAALSVRSGLVGALVMPAAFAFGLRWGITGLAWAWLVGMAVLLTATILISLPAIGAGRPLAHQLHGRLAVGHRRDVLAIVGPQEAILERLQIDQLLQLRPGLDKRRIGEGALPGVGLFEGGFAADPGDHVDPVEVARPLVLLAQRDRRDIRGLQLLDVSAADSIIEVHVTFIDSPALLEGEGARVRDLRRHTLRFVVSAALLC